MGSQPSSNFLGIEASCFNFSSLICIMALVICFVKATFISLALGVSARFCKNLINSVTLQPSKSKLFSSKLKQQLSPIFLKISAHLSGVFLIDFCTFLYIRANFPRGPTQSTRIEACVDIRRHTSPNTDVPCCKARELQVTNP